MATEDKLTTLYDWLEIMTKAGDAVKEKHETEFLKLIEIVKSSTNKERILAAQLIARFFKYFKEHEEVAFDSIVDLCESSDVEVRKHATMNMISICRDCHHLVMKAADILIQLYQTKENSEVNLINRSLMTLLSLDISNFLDSFFTNFEDGSEVVRERSLKFLATHLPRVSDVAMTKEVEEKILTYSEKAMEDVTKGEFITFVSILSKLKFAKTVAGKGKIVHVIREQADLKHPFKIEDKDHIDKVLLCARHTIPLLTQYTRASEYINYICQNILPHIEELSSNGLDLTVLQTLAEMSQFIHSEDIPNLIDLDKCQLAVYEKLLEYIPVPQTLDPDSKPKQTDGGQEKLDASETDPTNGNKVSDSLDQSKSSSGQPKDSDVKPMEMEQQTNNTKIDAKKQDTDFLFTHIEYLIYTFHQFGRIKPEFFNEARQNEIKQRLYNLALGCTKYMNILGTQLKNVRNQRDLNDEENKIRQVALQTTKNIYNIVIRDLLKRPAQFKFNVTLSSLSQNNSGDSNPNTKRWKDNNHVDEGFVDVEIAYVGVHKKITRTMLSPDRPVMTTRLDKWSQ